MSLCKGFFSQLKPKQNDLLTLIHQPFVWMESGQTGGSLSYPTNTTPSEFLCTNLLENSNSVSMTWKKTLHLKSFLFIFKQGCIYPEGLAVGTCSYGWNSNIKKHPM